jgi:hypothetical protein
MTPVQEAEVGGSWVGGQYGLRATTRLARSCLKKRTATKEFALKILQERGRLPSSVHTSMFSWCLGTF